MLGKNPFNGLRKKAQLSYIVYIILALAGATVIILFLLLTKANLEEKVPLRACHDSIFLRAQTAPKILGQSANVAPLACATKTNEVKGTREQIKAQLARELSECRWMFEHANDNILDTFRVKKLFFSSSPNQCFPCYISHIKQEDLGPEGPIEPTEMMQYLRETEHYNIPGVKYMEYLQTFGGTKTSVGVFDEIRPGEAYAITFMSKNTEDPAESLVDSSIITAVGGTGVALAGLCVLLEPCGLIAAIGVGIPAAAVAAFGTVTSVDNAAELLQSTKKGIYQSKQRSTNLILVDSLPSLQQGGCDIRSLS